VPETTVTLVDVDSRDVTARGEQTTVYSFKASDGRKYDTFRRDIAVPGSTLRGKTVVIDYKERKKGEYTNYDLLSIREAADAVLLQGFKQEPTPNISSQSDKDVSIARAVALKAAVETAVGLQIETDKEGVVAIAGFYADWLLNGTAVAEPSDDLSMVNF
jgi:hypothetical protein